MASQELIRANLVNDKGTWTVRARFADTADGRRRLHSKSTGFKVAGNNKRKAEAAMREIVAEWERSINAAKPTDNPPFRDCVNNLLDRMALSLRPNTLASYRDITRIHIIPSLGEIGICDLTRHDLLCYFEEKLKSGQSVSSMKKHKVIIRGAIKDAIMNELIPSDITDCISLPKRKKYGGKSLNKSQIEVLFEKLSAQPEPARIVVTLALAYGLRRSEICGLRWDDVDFQNRKIHIQNTLVEYNGEYWEVAQTKTKASNRTICFVPGTEDYLFELLERQKQSGAYTGKVCAHPDGRFLRPEYVTRVCKKILNSCGIEGIRLHDLRHTAATILVRHVSPKQAQKFLGHEDCQTTMNIYAHVMDEDDVLTSDAMGAYLQGAGFNCSENCSETDMPVPDNIILLSQKVENKIAKGL